MYFVYASVYTTHTAAVCLYPLAIRIAKAQTSGSVISCCAEVTNYYTGWLSFRLNQVLNSVWEHSLNWTHIHICYMLLPVHLSSVCLLSVTLVHPTQPVEIFGIVMPFSTLAIHWHLRKILRRSSQGNPYVGELNARGVAKYSSLDLLKATSWKWCKRGAKLVLITNRKSHMSFQLPDNWYQNRWPWMA